MAKQATKQEKRHMQAVASVGCVVCRNLGFAPQPLEYTAIHHVRWGQGMAQRAPNHLTLPLCAKHHQTGGFGVAFHAGPHEWERRYGTEQVLLMQIYLMLENAADYGLLPNNGGCGCEYCQGGWRELLGVANA